MTKFSTNLEFLWADLPPNAIHAAHFAGFDAVECHWQYETDTALINPALSEKGLRMLGLNTKRGNHLSGDNGLSVLPARNAEAHSAIDQAINYATAINCTIIHIMAEFAAGVKAHDTFVKNLSYVCTSAANTTSQSWSNP